MSFCLKLRIPFIGGLLLKSRKRKQRAPSNDRPDDIDSLVGVIKGNAIACWDHDRADAVTARADLNAAVDMLAGMARGQQIREDR